MLHYYTARGFCIGTSSTLTKNASAYFQSTIPSIFDSIKYAMNVWIDEFTLHSKVEAQLLSHLEELFRIRRQHNLYLPAKKSVLYTKEVKWCVRVIDSIGYKLEQRDVGALKPIDDPNNVTELCQFIHSCRYMSTSIPVFPRRMRP